MLDKYDPFFHLIACGMYLFYIHLILALEFEKKRKRKKIRCIFQCTLSHIPIPTIHLIEHKRYSSLGQE